MEKISIQASIIADRGKVWDYYTLPEHITKWNFASEDWQCPKVRNDMRVGGKYSARMEAKDGSYGFDFDGIYNEITMGEKFSYTLGDGRKVMVAFQDLGDKTHVTINFDPETENSIDLQREGWQAILNNFKKYVES